jgi:1-deoxy-D-xylulose-5-phosphate reductoisomerase
MKNISIFGITGSIGQQATKLILDSPNDYKLVAITAQSNVALLISQAKLLKPQLAVIGEDKLYEVLREGLAGTGIKVASGQEGMNEASTMKCEIALMAIVGIAALMPTINLIRSGANIALVNKECLVCAGELMLSEVEKHNVKIIPVDSEHSAIFQIFDHANPESIDAIILTASGGPFLHLPQEEWGEITKAQALKHPTWRMGNKVTIDSATLMNKALEIIEAHYLFQVVAEQIEVIIHPESIIHSMVRYVDGAVLSHLGISDMTIPISYALSWPNRARLSLPQLDLAKLSKLTFFAPDTEKFTSLNLVRQVLASKGAAPIIFNAANELAVKYFLEDKIKFIDILPTITSALDQLSYPSPTSIEEVIAIDQMVKDGLALTNY